MTTHYLDILIQEAQDNVYIKPLGFLYEPDNTTVSNFEKQIRDIPPSKWYITAT